MTSMLQSIPSPMKIREELERMVLNDLLGPVGGPEEEIEEQTGIALGITLHPQGQTSRLASALHSFIPFIST
jgi:hypothetical protein